MAKTDRPSSRSPLTHMLSEVLDAWMRQAMFTLPGRVLDFNPETQLAKVEAGIERVVNGQGITIPPIENIPVCFPGDGKYYFWHQITNGETEGLLHFNQRAIDTWIERGGPVAPHETRILSEEDCFFEPGYRSKPGAIPNFKNDGAGISNYAGDQYIHLKSNGNAEAYTPQDATVDVGNNLNATIGADATVDIQGNADITVGGDQTSNVSGNLSATVGGTASIEAVTSATIKSPSITLDGQVTITKSLAVNNTGGASTGASFSGDVTTSGGDMTADDISVKNHTHSQPADSNGDTQSDTDPPQ